MDKGKGKDSIYISLIYVVSLSSNHRQYHTIVNIVPSLLYSQYYIVPSLLVEAVLSSSYCHEATDQQSNSVALNSDGVFSPRPPIFSHKSIIDVHSVPSSRHPCRVNDLP